MTKEPTIMLLAKIATIQPLCNVCQDTPPCFVVLIQPDSSIRAKSLNTLHSPSVDLYVDGSIIPSLKHLLINKQSFDRRLHLVHISNKTTTTSLGDWYIYRQSFLKEKSVSLFVLLVCQIVKLFVRRCNQPRQKYPKNPGKHLYFKLHY